jgi:hypothetical protein
VIFLLIFNSTQPPECLRLHPGSRFVGRLPCPNAGQAFFILNAAAALIVIIASFPL